MLDCRYYDLCCFTDDSCNGEPECPKRDHCQFYSPMPDVKALTGLADKVIADTEEDVRSEDLVPAWQAGEALRDVASKIREACGEEGA